MQRGILAGCVAALTVSLVGQAQDMPQLPGPQKEHQWLQQLVGQWEGDVEAIVAPNQPAVKSKVTENVRAVGGFWIVCENQGDFMGVPFSGILTLGYDAQKKHYVGTWIDSMTGYLWTYRGQVDPEGKALTLHAEGPSPENPDKLMRFKEVLAIQGPDHKVFTSAIEGADGTYTTFMTIDYRRKK